MREGKRKRLDGRRARGREEERKANEERKKNSTIHNIAVYYSTSIIILHTHTPTTVERLKVTFGIEFKLFHLSWTQM